MVNPTVTGSGYMPMTPTDILPYMFFFQFPGVSVSRAIKTNPYKINTVLKHCIKVRIFLS
jgi:hypothetical protein